ncbi:MAG: hypothetical protein SNG27_10590 [Rikenellaceae bacterium]
MLHLVGEAFEPTNEVGAEGACSLCPTRRVKTSEAKSILALF